MNTLLYRGRDSWAGIVMGYCQEVRASIRGMDNDFSPQSSDRLWDACSHLSNEYQGPMTIFFYFWDFYVSSNEAPLQRDEGSDYKQSLPSTGGYSLTSPLSAYTRALDRPTNACIVTDLDETSS
jgi:hypothetical protein